MITGMKTKNNPSRMAAHGYPGTGGGGGGGEGSCTVMITVVEAEFPNAS
jgi:hypothetical protein